ncbi:hypothetical protein LTR78_010207 [Recurvomyces mirabilis]|uniref:DUF1917-domain-containing protein n=1 Tax=Recurvomyces mirabilis TaxID=574656 RepID=A0AAE0TQ28_9PEZI|nr:hypothetical protein LTR78_010207 [Recurvomyces mirabilis]KAK5149673.1 hypothetical protein LTS14_010734 [Recurvomyces mirabilis]
MSTEEYVDAVGWVSDDSEFYGNETIKARMESIVSPIPINFNTPPNIARANKKSPIALMQEAPTIAAKTAVSGRSRTLAGHTTTDLIDVSTTHRDPSAWQPHEPVLDFLRRAPVMNQATANLGPWLWVHSPRLPSHHVQQQQKTDTASFQDGGTQLLRAFKDQEAKIETSNPNKAVGIITRYLRPYREQLEDDLLQLAVSTHTTCGKWMLFPTIDDVARVWRVVAEAAAAGKLGPTCKVATYDELRPRADHLICIYTYDFTDLPDVRRVLETLVGLDLVSTSGRPIYYKCDAYTYLDLGSQNEYKIKASLYSSKDVLNGEVKALPDGPILRLLKRNGAIDTFMSG